MIEYRVIYNLSSCLCPDEVLRKRTEALEASMGHNRDIPVFYMSNDNIEYYDSMGYIKVSDHEEITKLLKDK